MANRRSFSLFCAYIAFIMVLSEKDALCISIACTPKFVNGVLYECCEEYDMCKNPVTAGYPVSSPNPFEHDNVTSTTASLGMVSPSAKK
ncbi:MAG: hypothetical protein [Bovine nidovirus 1]|nr:MAG: hypothetical protein [Bovine nidovirus 1]URQ03840.1 MAG: hypothetical protein [Bovine nidovirus 1]URQ03847.1 MAG: hypothetical protein [Bovine nidovirus 1]URQ03854.1 MAG: hypothetical protein [Bovine nidovirus 1]URQ03861.1 MAG: hypothetical protein [Bovine nidovirus 1]